MNEDISNRLNSSETIDIADNPEDFYKKLIGKTLTIKIKGKEIRLKEFIGKGSMSGVFRAEMNSQDIAIKILAPDLANKSEFVKRFENEANTMLQLPPHPHIVRGLFYGADTKHTLDFIAGSRLKQVPLHTLGMQYVEGKSLKEIIDERAEPEEQGNKSLPDFLEIFRPLPITRACDIITQIGEALVTAHELKKLHRDVKPANILIEKSGRAKLTDFGLVKEFGAADQTARGMTVGTPLYMSREQILREFSFSSDLYSLGATLYHIVTGWPPFTGVKEDNFSMDHLFHQITHEDPVPPRELNPYISKELQDAILRSMDKEVQYRHLKMQEFVDEMKALERQSFSTPIKETWLQRNRDNAAKKNVFDMLFSKEQIDLRQEVIGTPKEIIRECRDIESTLLHEKLVGIDNAGLETQMRNIEDIEKLIRSMVPRTDENVLERLNWMQKIMGIWNNLVKSNPDLVLDKGYAQNRLNWEDRMREKLNVALPEPQKTFWEKHWKKFLALAFTGMTLVAAGALGHIYGISQKRARELEQKKLGIHLTREEFNKIHAKTQKSIQRFEFEGADEDIKKLTSLQGKLDDSRLEENIQDLEALLEEKKEEYQTKSKQRDIETNIKKAYDAIKESTQEGLSKEKRDKKLQSAADLSKRIEAAIKRLEGGRADYFRRELDIIIGKIGPQLYAFETLHDAEIQYTEASKKYEALMKDWQDGKPISQSIIATLRRELTGSKNTLLRVEGDFTDEKNKKTNTYTTVIQNTDDLSDMLRRLHQETSFGQFRKARTNLDKIRERMQELSQDKKYFTDETAGARISRLEQEIQTRLNNIEGSPFIWEGSLKEFKEETKTVLKNWQPIKEKIQRAAELTGLELAEFYFDEQACDLAEKQFTEIKDDKAKLYLSAIRLERQKEKEKILARKGISQKHAEEYRQHISMLEQKDTGQTPQYILQSIQQMLERFCKIPELYLAAKTAQEKTKELNKLAWQIDPAEKQYEARLSEFIQKAKQEQAFTEVEKALDEYLFLGEQEQKPYVILALADTYADLGREKDAIQNYELFIKSSLVTEEEKEQAMQEIERLNK